MINMNGMNKKVSDVVELFSAINNSHQSYSWVKETKGREEDLQWKVEENSYFRPLFLSFYCFYCYCCCFVGVAAVVSAFIILLSSLLDFLFIFVHYMFFHYVLSSFFHYMLGIILLGYLAFLSFMFVAHVYHFMLFWISAIFSVTFSLALSGYCFLIY